MYQLKNPSLQFKLYIDTIPKSFKEYIYFWPKADLDKIKNTFLISLVNSRLKEFRVLQKIIKKSKIGKLNFTLNDIKHAYIAVSSRNFGVYVNNKFYYTCAPFTDLFNFDPKLNTTWTMRLKHLNDYFLIKSTKNIKKGEQIFVNYGRDDNVKLLTGYGFTLKNNPFPAKSNNFYIRYKGRFIWNSIHENKSNKLVNTIQRMKNFDIKKYKNIKNKALLRKSDIELFNIVLRALKSYSNKNLILKVKKNLKETPNTLNILRVLVTEDKLIKANVSYLNEFIRILKGGRLVMNALSRSRVVTQNIKYFNSLLD